MKILFLYTFVHKMPFHSSRKLFVVRACMQMASLLISQARYTSSETNIFVSSCVRVHPCNVHTFLLICKHLAQIYDVNAWRHVIRFESGAGHAIASRFPSFCFLTFFSKLFKPPLRQWICERSKFWRNCAMEIFRRQLLSKSFQFPKVVGNIWDFLRLADLIFRLTNHLFIRTTFIELDRTWEATENLTPAKRIRSRSANL